MSKNQRHSVNIKASQLKKGDRITLFHFVWEVQALKFVSFTDAHHVVVRVKTVGGTTHGEVYTQLYDQTDSLVVLRFVV